MNTGVVPIVSGSLPGVPSGRGDALRLFDIKLKSAKEFAQDAAASAARQELPEVQVLGSGLPSLSDITRRFLAEVREAREANAIERERQAEQQAAKQAAERAQKAAAAKQVQAQQAEEAVAEEAVAEEAPLKLGAADESQEIPALTEQTPIETDTAGGADNTAEQQLDGLASSAAGAVNLPVPGSSQAAATTAPKPRPGKGTALLQAATSSLRSATYAELSAVHRFNP